MTVPIVRPPGGDGEHALHSPLHRLEHALARFVPFVIIPIFGFANVAAVLGSIVLMLSPRPDAAQARAF